MTLRKTRVESDVAVRDSVRNITVMRIAWTVLVSFVFTTVTETRQYTSVRLPPRLESYVINDVRLNPAQQRRLIDGAPVTKLLDVDESQEVAVFGAIWIDAPIRRYVEAVRDIENFEQGGAFKVTERISQPPRLEDFALLRLPDGDVSSLRTCRVGDCDVQLSARALRRFGTEVDWTAPSVRSTVDGLMRQLAYEYASSYLEGGNERLAVYRDSDRPTFVAREFRAMVDQMPELTTYMPDVRRYLLDYPKASLPGATSFLYWQQTEFGLKPTIRISHLTIREGSDDTVVVSKMLYASHYFWTGLELRTLLSDPSRGPGFWFVTVNCSRSDGLSGFKGMFVRRRVRSEVQESTMTGLERTKRMIEGRRSAK